jgi:hypothetical protein
VQSAYLLEVLYPKIIDIAVSTRKHLYFGETKQQKARCRPIEDKPNNYQESFNSFHPLPPFFLLLQKTFRLNIVRQQHSNEEWQKPLG